MSFKKVLCIEQFRKVQNMGSISQILGMIPGMGNIKQQLNVDELDDDWDAVTFDDLYTPGSYWVNPPSPRSTSA